MQVGKVPYNTMIRSIQKTLRPRRPEVWRGVGIQNDCSVLDLSGGALVVSKNPAIYLKEAMSHSSWMDAAFYRCLNDCLSSCGSPFSFEAVFFLPETMSEEAFRSLILHLEGLCTENQMEYSGGHTQILGELQAPMAAFTMYGRLDPLLIPDKKNTLKNRREQEKLFWPKAGQSIVMTGYAGAEVSALLAETFYEKLSSRFTEDFLLRSTSYLKYLCGSFEAAVARKHGVTAMHNISSGGVLGCLWEMTEGAHLGCSVDLRKIPVRQDTIELCEIFELDPYKLSSCGSMLFACDDGEKLVEELILQGIPAAVIGSFESGSVKRLRNLLEERFLDRPGKDQLSEVLKKWYQM